VRTHARHPDFAAEGLLDGLAGDQRRQRLELLRWLTDEGFDLQQLRGAHRRGVLLFLAAERAVGGEPRYTWDEVAAASGADVDFLIRLRRGQGLPVPGRGAAELTEVDLASARTAKAWLQVGLTEEQMAHVTRAIGSSLSRAAEAMRAVLMEVVVEPGSTERQLAESYATAAQEVMPLVGPTVVEMVTQHLRNMVETEVLGALELAAGRPPGSLDLTVAFADLVGFTRLGEEVPPEHLGLVAERLADIAADVLPPSVRIIKTIGDAVLLTGLEPAAVVTAGLGIIDAVGQAGDLLPQVRVGIAYGAAVPRGGDVYGRAVNLASRVTAVARAGSVLATREVRDAARDAFQWSSAGARRLKGLPEPVSLYRARAVATPAA